MGELIELTTWPKAHNSFYKITSSALAVEIKAIGNAAIGLSREPNNNCDFWIIIGEGQHCWIKEAGCGTQDTGACVPNILSIEEYRKFWITWSHGQVRLGLDGQTTPLIFCYNSIQDMNYITFSVVQRRNPVHWRFEIPPTSESIKYKPIQEGQLHWVTYTAGEVLPEDLLVGGFEHEKLYIARASHRGSLTPGKFVPSKGEAYISWDGQANKKTEFEVLCGFDGIWVPAVEDRIPVGAFVAGYSEMGSERLFIGRAEHDGHLIPGKIHPPYKKLLFSYQGSEVGARKYEILVLPKQNERCVNPFILLDSESYVQRIEESVSDEEQYAF